MPHLTLESPEENIALLLEVANAMGLEAENILVKDGSPDWHQNILNERLEKYNVGKTGVTSWEEIEKEMNDEDKSNDL